MSNTALESKNLLGEVKTLRVFDRQSAAYVDKEVTAFEFMMDTEGTLTCTSGMSRRHFPMPEELEGYFTQFNKTLVLWCTWEEDGLMPARPTAIPFEGELLPLK
jgi:hypothetical protein